MQGGELTIRQFERKKCSGERRMIECPQRPTDPPRAFHLYPDAGNKLDSLVSHGSQRNAHSAQRKTFFIGILTRNPDYLMAHLGRKLNTYGKSVRVKHNARG